MKLDDKVAIITGAGRGIGKAIAVAYLLYFRLRSRGANDLRSFGRNVNLRGTFLCTKFALPSMLERGTGCIINISSGAGKRGVPNRSAYSASKFGVNGFTETLAAEYLRKGIRPHVICPGPVVSQMRSEGFPDEDPATLIQAEDIADAAVFLAAQKPTAYTLEMVVNNGQAIRNRER